MEKEIELKERSIKYLLKKSDRAKHMRLAIYSGGDFIVTVPINTELYNIEKFIIKKSQWIIEKIDYLSKFTRQPRVKKFTRKDYIKNKEVAKKIAHEKVEYFNKIYNLRFNKITIKNQKTRWGSCSQKGNLNFNYKIALLPEKMVDYIVVHELCHLREFNHSKNFWALVTKTIPDYAHIRRELRKNIFKFQ